ncbi:hypothetical protein GOODEAATRI_023125 [Goodea atripinnis]|uniref:IPT/TIG domain-containing protein n=1 Tax=Goodea atripinnis TaxID=208336 RepID=A0ABV0NCY0_9TELE
MSRCSRKHECEHHLLANHWLWSFELTNQCVTVQSLQPANQSREEQTQVMQSTGKIGLVFYRTIELFGLEGGASNDSSGPSSCPLVVSLRSSALVPMGLNTTIVLEGRNLDVYMVLPVSGPLEGGVLVTITGSNLGTRYHDVVGGVKVADVPCVAQPEGYRISTRGGRVMKVTGRNLDVVQEPAIFVWVEPLEVQRVKRRRRLALLTAKQRLVFNGTMTTVSERCSVRSSSEITCWTPAVSPEVRVKGVWFQLDNVRVHYDSIEGKSFTYYPNPQLFSLNREAPDAPYRFKPGGVIAVEVQKLSQNGPMDTTGGLIS